MPYNILQMKLKVKEIKAGEIYFIASMGLNQLGLPNIHTFPFIVSNCWKGCHEHYVLCIT